MRLLPLLPRAVLGGAIFAAVLVAAIGPARATPSPSGGVLVWPALYFQWPKALDPAQTTDPTSAQIVDLLYNGLVKLDGHNNVVPDLADALPRLSPDRRTYTFTLRPHLRFSDGSLLTADDVVYSLARATSRQEVSPGASYLSHIKGFAAWNAGKSASLMGVRALDARTVQITLDTPASYFLAALTLPLADVVKRNVATGEDLVGSGAQARNIGAGPWVFDGPWRYRQEMDFIPNPHWYRAGQLKLSALRVPFILSQDTNYREYQAGQVPVTVVPAAHVPADRTRPDFHAALTLEIEYLTPNLGRDSQCSPVSCAPFNDLHFRRALLYAIDRQLITHVIYHGTEVPLCGMVPQGLAGYDPGLCALTPYDPVRAKRELALARKDFGGTLPNEGQLTMPYPNAGQAVDAAEQEIQVEWQAIGINIRPVATPGIQYVTLRAGSFTPFLDNGWIADYPDPQDYTEFEFRSGGFANAGNYHNPAFDRLMERADGTPNDPQRTILYVQAQKLLIDDVAFIPIGQVVWHFRWRPNIHGLFTSTNWYWPQPLNQDWTNVWVS
jgi:peptide/nickel transport system substrate-binding protein/oligopeptide transport system substrate-binding protein